MFYFNVLKQEIKKNVFRIINPNYLSIIILVCTRFHLNANNKKICIKKIIQSCVFSLHKKSKKKKCYSMLMEENLKSDCGLRNSNCTYITIVPFAAFHLIKIINIIINITSCCNYSKHI